MLTTTELVGDPWLVSSVTLNGRQWQTAVDQTCNGAVKRLCHLVARVHAVQWRPVSVGDHLPQQRAAVGVMTALTDCFLIFLSQFISDICILSGQNKTFHIIYS